MVSPWLFGSWEAAGWGVVTAVAIYGAIIALTRLAGLRSLASMSAYDMATTVAIGSTLAAAMSNPSPQLVHTLITLTTLYGAQIVVARLRMAGGGGMARVIDNSPLLLVRDGEMLRDNMSAARITPGDLRGQLRQQGRATLVGVSAVILETTGAMSILDEWPSDEMMEGVRLTA